MVAIMRLTWFLTQFQAELGGGPHREVAGAGVRQPGLPSVRLRLRLRGLSGPGAVAGQQRRQAEGLPGRAERWGAPAGQLGAGAL